MEEEPAFNVLLRDQVYNIARFMRVHPGGKNLLDGTRNRDIGHQMEKYGHNEHAYHLLEGYKVDGISGKSNGVDGKSNGVNGKSNGVNGKSNGVNGKSEKANFEERLKEIEKLEALVDWDKPMLPQLEKLGDNYNKWIDSPIDKKVKYFENQYLEYLTMAPWYIVLVYWVPVVSCMLWYTFTKYVACGDSCVEVVSPLSYLLHLLLGMGVWTILEYTLHRFLFHAKPQSSLAFKQFHFMVHGLHHKTPFDIDRQVFPPFGATIAATIVYLLASLLLMPFRSFLIPIIGTTGTILGYIMYDYFHFYLHHGAPKDGSLLYTMKRYHANHHFNNPHIGFGVTSKFWDVIFSTKINIKALGFSLSWK